MSSRIRINIEDPKGAEIWIPCEGCNRETSHKILSHVSTTDESPDGDIIVWAEFHIVQCQGCKTVSFCHKYSCSEDLTIDPETGESYPEPTYNCYPSRIAGRSMVMDTHYLPHGVYKIYYETHGALCNKLNILAGIGIRAIVEAVCKEEKVEGSNLAEKIDGLASGGLITSAGSKILHNLRFMGNTAAHEMKSHSGKERMLHSMSLNTC